MDRFSNEQLAAIKTTNAHTAVIAGAGSGKTTVLIARINEILKEGTSAKDVLAITFTRKAATEMVERIENKDVNIKTFDAFCYDLVLTHLNENIRILDTSPFTEVDINKFNIYDVNNKDGAKPLKYDDYVKFKKENDLYDFNDIEYLALDLIKKHNIKYEHVLIDEFQDTNELQYLVFKELIKNNSKSFVVGDPDQSIYGFRGAKFQIIAKYINEFSAKTLILSNNYRSTKEILEKANNLIVNNKQRIEKELVPVTKDTGRVDIRKFYNENFEFEYVVKNYEELKDQYKTFAILYRNNFQGNIYRRYFQNKNENILITTIHQSKGLEFDVVFLVGVNEKILPAERITKVSEMEEERRLFFVAITRAKRLLFISSSTNSNIAGVNMYHKPSKFIRELKVSTKKEVREVRAIPKPKLETYEVNDTVRHINFGVGTITNINNKILTVDFGFEIGEKKLMANHNSIKKI